MGRSWLYAAVFVAAGFAAPAAAQEQPQDFRAAAQALIDTAQLGDLFEPIEDDHVSVRHTASGLVCHFHDQAANPQLVTFSGQPRGDDVGCLTNTAVRSTTLYATRYSPPKSPEQALGEAVAAIRQRFTDAEPTPMTAQFSSDALPQQHAAYFFATIRGERWITGAIVAQSGDWIIKLRYSARCPDEQDVMTHQLEAGGIFTLALLDIAGLQRAD